MRLSRFTLNITKDITSEVKLRSHQLMLKSGMIKQSSSGVYYWLPLGVRVLKKIKYLIRQELNEIGSQEVIAPSLQPITIWQKSGRAAKESELGAQTLRIIGQKKQQYVLPPSGEEAITSLFNSNATYSYKNAGKILYQITWKFRDEIRPRHGVMRAKEFLMKDAYSFDITKEKAILSYEEVFKAYLKIFRRLGIKVIPVLAASGEMGGSYSHEFHILAQDGESTIYYQNGLSAYLSSSSFSLKEYETLYAKEKEKHSSQNIKDLGIIESKSIEVGHLFYLGQKYSESFNCMYQDKDNVLRCFEMGSYGIGITRLVAAVIENSNDKNGIVWPKSISPFKLVLINANLDNTKCNELTERIYIKLSEKYEVIYWDSTSNNNKRFTDIDLIGISWQVIIKARNLSHNKGIEVKNRKTGRSVLLDESELFNFNEFL